MSSEQAPDRCGRQPNPSKPHLPNDPESCFRWVVCEVTERLERINYYLKLCQNGEFGSNDQKSAEAVCLTLSRDLQGFLKSRPLGLLVRIVPQVVPLLEDDVPTIGDGDCDSTMDQFIASLTDSTLPTRYIQGVKVFVGGEKRGEDSSSSSGSSSSTVVDPFLPPIRE